MARLLLSRARALIELGQLDEALTDLDASLHWLAHDKDPPKLLEAEIHLTQATALLRTHQGAQALSHLKSARAAAVSSGKVAAGLLCDALLLEGDLMLRAAEAKRVAPPESYYRQVFQVAAQFDYPEDTWPHLDRALGRLQISDATARSALMGPVDERRKAQEVDASASLVRARETQHEAVFASVASGSIPGAGDTIAALHQDGFRRCYQQALAENPETSGSVRLRISVRGDGTVQSVEETHQGLRPSVVDCVVAVARGAQFSRPDSTQAVVFVPINFIKQSD